MLVLLCSSSVLAQEDPRGAEEAASFFRLAQALLDKGDLDAALDTARQALATQQRVYGPEHLETAYYRVLVGQVLYAQGDLEEAFEATRHALDIHERGLGYDHPDSATILAFLATILKTRGDLDGALQYQRRALQIYEKSPGPDNINNAIQALANLGSTLYKKGDLKEALEVTREALRRDQKLFGPDHLRVAQRYRNLAWMHLKLGDLEAALQNTRKALQILQRSLGTDDPETAMTVGTLGAVFQEKGDLEAALSFHRSALQVEERYYGPNHSNVAVRLNSLAGVLLEKGDLQGALKNAQRALQIDEEPGTLDAPSVALDCDLLARIFLKKGDLDGALKASRRALSIDESTYGEDHYEVARDSDTQAAILLARGESEAALRAARRALAIGEKTFGPDIPTVARYAYSVGLVLRKQGNTKEAQRYFEQANRVFATKYGLDHPMTRKTAQDLDSVTGGLRLSRTALLTIAAVAVTLIALVLLFLFLRERRTLAHTLALSKTAPPVQAAAEEPSTAAEGPKRIGPYRLEDRLGEGGMGVVYRAYDERLERWVAVKVIPPDKSRDPHRRERLRREAQASARLSHPAIIQVHDFVHTEQADGIVMELVEGELLTRLLWAGPLDLQRALPVARDIAEAMAEAHSKGIIHRDLKSENVIVTPAWRAKILDFGIAKRLDRSEPALTTEGAVIGTYRTMAPEQAQGQEVDHRADLFALGTLFYEMFTGRSPFLGTSAADTMWRICCHRQSPAREVNSRVPEELSDLIDWLLQKEPQHRPRDAREVVIVLAGVAGSGPPSGSETACMVPEPEASTFLEASPLLERPLSARDPEPS